MPAIVFATGVFLAKDTALPLSLGKVYIGSADLDPEILANRINVTVINEDGTETIIAPAQQPLILSIGGMMNYPYNTGGAGSVVQMKVSAQFSCKVFDAGDVQQYYFPRAVVNDATFVGDVVIDGDTTINGDLTIVNGSYVGYQREAILDIESIAGEAELDCQAAAYFNITLTENTLFSFSNIPSVSAGYGQTWLLTIDNAGSFSTAFVEDGFTLYRRSSDDFVFGAGTTAKVVFSSCQVGNIFALPLKDIIPDV